MVFIAKDKEAFCGRGCEGSQPLVNRAVSMTYFLQNHSHNDDIIDSSML